MSINNIRILSQPISYQELLSIHGLKVSGIYKIENTVNHKVYIGQSKDVINRLRGHTRFEENPHLKSAFDKYDFDNFSFEVIKETYDMDYWETYLIHIYHLQDSQYGYNILPGGEGGDSEVTRQQWQDPVIRQKRLDSTKEFWNSPEGIRQRQINSERQKDSHTTKGKHWYNNGTKNVQTFECPPGFVPGRLGNFTCSEETKQKKREYEKNLTPEQRKARSEKISAAHIGKPLTKTRKENISKAKKGRKYFNNGIIEVMRFECPEGFVPGRCPKSK